MGDVFLDFGYDIDPPDHRLNESGIPDLQTHGGPAKDDVSNYKRSLDLRNGVVTTSYQYQGVSY